MAGNRSIFEQAMNRGHSAAWDQQWDKAIAYYRAALTEFPEDHAALSALGFVLFQSDRLEEALTVYQRAAVQAPGDPVAPEKCGEIFERLARINEAVQTYLAVADLHLRRRDVNKAIDLWNRVVRLAPDHLQARMLLIRALENTEQPRAAALEYVDIARIFQSLRDLEKAGQSLQRALQLDPQTPEVRAAFERFRRNQPIPPVTRVAPGQRGTGMLNLAALEDEPPTDGRATDGALSEAPDKAASPLDGARERASAALAEMLFEEDADTSKVSASVSVSALTRGLGSGRDAESVRAQIVMYLGQALNSHTAGNLEAAASNFHAALEAGFDHPLAHFMLGALLLELNRPPDAIDYLAAAQSHQAVRLGCLYGLGEAYRQTGQVRKSFEYFLEAVKQLDLSLIAPERQDRLIEAYETLAETFSRAPDSQVAQIIPGLKRFLSGDHWEENARRTRRQLDAEDGHVTALADQVAIPAGDEVLDAMRRIDDYMKRQLYATAMEEALFALEISPTYLPIHIRMAEILVAENRPEIAAEKYKVIANTYEVRGEAARASRLLQQALKLNPMDIAARRQLINLLTSQGRTEEALQHYSELADMYYDLADLETARETYAEALKVAQQSGNRQWSFNLLHRLGDIHMQRLAWRDALRVYEQVRQLMPDDEKARIALIDLHYRLNNPRLALSELDAYLKLMIGQRNLATPTVVLEELLNSYPDDPQLIARLARLYQDQGRKADAITRYDQLADIQLQQGQNDQAKETLRVILALGPDDPTLYRQLLDQL
jgi:tetratricopeptide (TPR) repeat protein